MQGPGGYEPVGYGRESHYNFGNPGGLNIYRIDPSLMGQWRYRCIFCSQTFNSGRALGGHQNAHRFESRDNIDNHGRRSPHIRLARQQSQTTTHHDLVSQPADPRFYSQGGYFPTPFNYPFMNYYHGLLQQHAAAAAGAAAGGGSHEGRRTIPFLGPAPGMEDQEMELDLELRLGIGNRN